FRLFSRDLLSVDKLLHERLVLRDLIDLAVSYQVCAAIAYLYQVHAPWGDSDARKRRSHPLELRVRPPLLMYEVVGVKRRVVEFGDKLVIVCFGGESRVNVIFRC